MRNDFLIIPDAPNYEINSELICRHKPSGKILKLHKKINGSLYYDLYGAKRFNRSPKYLRRIAVAAAENSTFAPIPSINYRYEINRDGTVRNSKTKCIVNTLKGKKTIAFLTTDGKLIRRHIDELLWEVHGRPLKHTKQPCPCQAVNFNQTFSFPSLRACAKFLAGKLFYCVSYIAHKLCKRPPAIGDWKIIYLDYPLNNVNWDSRELNREAHRQRRIAKDITS